VQLIYFLASTYIIFYIHRVQTKFSHSKQLLKSVHSVVSTVLFTDDKDIYSAHTENPKGSPTVRNCSNKEERRDDETPMHTIK